MNSEKNVLKAILRRSLIRTRIVSGDVSVNILQEIVLVGP